MPEQYSVEEIADLNDLRRRIANGGEYTDDEVAKAISLFTRKRTEAASTAPKAPKQKKTTVKTIDLDDML